MSTPPPPPPPPPPDSPRPEPPSQSQAPSFPPPVFSEPLTSDESNGNRRPLVIGLAALGVVIALAIGVGVVSTTMFGKDNDHSATDSTSLAAGKFLSEPNSTWTVSAQQILSDSNAVFFDPSYDGRNYLSAGALRLNDTVVVGLSDGDTSRGPELSILGFDAGSGEMLWKKPTQQSGGCAHALIDGLLPCIDNPSTGQSTVQFIDPRTGTEDSSVTVPYYASAVEPDDDSLYLTGYASGTDETVIQKGNRSNPGEDWIQRYVSTPCTFVGSGDSNALEIDEGLVAVVSATSILAKSSDGQQVGADGRGGSLLPGQGGRVTLCNENNPSNSKFESRIVDSDGTEKFTTSENIVDYAFRQTDDASSPLLTSTGSGLDPESGTPLWTRVDLEDSLISAALIDDKILVSTASGVQALAVGSGETLWTIDGTGIDFEESDGEVLLSSTSGSVSAYALSDGQIQWTKAAGQSSDDRSTIGPSASGALYASASTLAQLSGADTSPESSGGSERTESDSYVTKCGTAPTFAPTNVVTQSGALSVTMRITASCPGGDVLSGSETRIALAESGQNVAAGSFDLSSSPIFVPRTDTGSDSYVEQDFRFPPGTYWRVPESMTAAISKANSGSTGSTFLVECEQAGTIVTSSGEFTGSTTAVTARGPARPLTGDAESASFDALRAIANADKPVVIKELGERWMPQISSKRLGLVAEGITWNNAAILREHLDMRLRYPNVKLLWSGEWNVFSYKDFWVTTAGVASNEPAAANRWCSDNGLDADHCFAKLVSVTHPVEGSTASR